MEQVEQLQGKAEPAGGETKPRPAAQVAFGRWIALGVTLNFPGTAHQGWKSRAVRSGTGKSA